MRLPKIFLKNKSRKKYLTIAPPYDKNKEKNDYLSEVNRIWHSTVLTKK